MRVTAFQSRRLPDRFCSHLIYGLLLGLAGGTDKLTGNRWICLTELSPEVSHSRIGCWRSGTSCGIRPWRPGSGGDALLLP